MRLKDHYDWIVLGDHPGALFSAVLASRLGLTVLILPFGSSSLARMSDSGQYLDPESNFMMGLRDDEKQPGVLIQSLKRILPNRTIPQLAASSEISQRVYPEVLTPRHRVNFGVPFSSIKNELKRELGNPFVEMSGLVSAFEYSHKISDRFWRDYPRTFLSLRIGKSRRVSKKPPRLRNQRSQAEDSGYAVGRAREFFSSESINVEASSKAWFLSGMDGNSFIRKALKKLQLLRDQNVEGLSELLSGSLFSVHSVDLENPRLQDFIHLSMLAKSGAAFPEGMTGLRRWLTQVAQESGAQIPDQLECRRVFIEENQLMGVQVTQKGKMISVSGGVLGCALSQVRELLYLSGKKGDHYLKLAPQPKGWRFTVALTVHREAIPPSMQSRVVWKEEGAPSIEIEVSKTEDYDLGETDQRLVFLRTCLPFTVESLDVEYQRLIASRMFRQLIEVFPFLEYHVVKAYPDFRKEAGSSQREFREVYGFKTLEEIPENIRSIEEPGIGSLSGVQGLYVASTESYPFLGSFGGMISGLEAVTHFVREREKERYKQAASDRGQEAAAREVQKKNLQKVQELWC